MLLNDFVNVSQAETIEAFKGSLVAFAARLDFPLVVSSLVTDHPKAPSTFISVSNMPTGYDAFNSPEDSRRDPVLKQLKVLNTPVVYDQRTYVEAGAADLWEQQAEYGYRTGIAIALHLPHGRHLLLGVDRDKPLPPSV